MLTLLSCSANVVIHVSLTFCVNVLTADSGCCGPDVLTASRCQTQSVMREKKDGCELRAVSYTFIIQGHFHWFHLIYSSTLETSIKHRSIQNHQDSSVSRDTGQSVEPDRCSEQKNC